MLHQKHEEEKIYAINLRFLTGLQARKRRRPHKHPSTFDRSPEPGRKSSTYDWLPGTGRKKKFFDIFKNN